VRADEAGQTSEGIEFRGERESKRIRRSHVGVTLCFCVPLLIPDQDFILFLLPHESPRLKTRSSLEYICRFR